MKLSLAAKNGISILNIAGPIDIQNFKILKAGITKIFKDGKNNILLNLHAVERIESDVLREITILDITARELSGRIAISCDNPETKQSIINFSKPPVIPIFANDDQALDFFAKLNQDNEVEPGDAEALKKALDAKEKEVEALKEQIKILDPAVVQQLRVDNQTIIALNKDLEQRLKDMVIIRRSPPDEASYMDKIAILEKTLEDLTAKLEAAQKKA